MFLIISIFTILILFLILFTYFILIFNKVKNLENNIDKNYANIDVLLKQRFDEINNLVEVIKGYMEHEKEILENISKKRSAFEKSDNLNSKNNIDLLINKDLNAIQYKVEAYPDLKSSDLFNKLMLRITKLEEKIADRRELFNDSINLLNINLNTFPNNIFLKAFKKKKFIKLDF